MLERVRERVHRSQSERVFLEAQRALMQQPRITLGLVGCYVVAGLLFLIPAAIFGLAIWLLFWQSQNMFAILSGLVLLWITYVLIPRPSKHDALTFGRDEMPELMRLVDAVADALDAPVPDGLSFDYQINASAWTVGLVRRRHFLQIGVPLWRLYEPQQRVALIAHELAHFVNGDPARGGFVGGALHAVERWDFLLRPDADDPLGRDLVGMVAELLQWLLILPVLGLGRLLVLLQFNRSQRAEYLADGLAAQVAGRDALVSGLRLLALTPIADRAIFQLYPFDSDQNARVFDVMIGAVQNATKEERATLEAEAAKEKARVDASHPPTSYRMAFLELIEPSAPKVKATDFDFDLIAVEMQSEADRQGKRLMQLHEVQ